MVDKNTPLGPPKAAPPDPNPQAVLLRALHQRLPARAAHVFAGLSVAADHTIQVHATVVDASLVDEIERTRTELHSAVPVRVLAGCRNTLVELEQVHVGLAQVTPAATAWLEQEFGAETIAMFESDGWSF